MLELKEGVSAKFTSLFIVHAFLLCIQVGDVFSYLMRRYIPLIASFLFGGR